MTFQLRGRDGHYRWFLPRVEPGRHAQGALTRWLGTNTDVTEMRQPREQPRNAYADLAAQGVFRDLELGREAPQLRQRLGAA